MSDRHASWCFTLNNPTDAELSGLRGLGSDNKSCKYLVIGNEQGESGTPHVQGFVVFKRRNRLDTVKLLLGNNRTHLEPMRGTHKQASDYCKKDGDFTEYGTLPEPRKSAKLSDAIERLYDTRSLHDVAKQYPETFVRHGRGLISLAQFGGIYTPRANKTYVTVFIGAPGVGKSRRAFEAASTIGRIYYKPNGEWWDGYDGQEAVIFDDFYGNYPFHDLLKCLDRYPHKVAVKGAFAEFIPKEIFITSNRCPSTWYNWEKVGEAQALYRRIDKYTRITEEEDEEGLDYEERETGVRRSICY